MIYSYYFQSLYYFHIAYSNQFIVQSTNLQSIHHFLLSPIILLPISTIKHNCLITSFFNLLPLISLVLFNSYQSPFILFQISTNSYQSSSSIFPISINFYQRPILFSLFSTNFNQSQSSIFLIFINLFQSLSISFKVLFFFFNLFQS